MATTVKKSPELGYGGVDYNTAETAMKKQIAQNQANIANNPAYKDNEIQRALQVIVDRNKAGENSSDQVKYLTKNLGYTGDIPGINNSKTITNSAAPTIQPSQAASPSYSQQGSELMNLMRQIATRESTPFSYDPNSDPAYQAALQRARSNIDQGNSAAQAEMNRRGILNSTITSDRMGEIASNEMGRVETDVLPALMQQAYQKYIDQENLKQQQFSNYGNLAQMYINEDQRGIDNTNTRAQMTGYLPGGEEARQLVTQLLGLKQQAEAKGITAAERTKLSNQADGIRAMLSQMGVDASQYGANVNYNTASQVTPTIRTLAGQQMDMSRQGQAFNQQFSQEQFAYQKVRDAITDKQWQAQFDQSVRQFGLNYALSQLQENNQQAYRQAQIALSQDDNDRQWISLENSMSGSSYSGMTPTQVLDAARNQFSIEDEDGNKSIPRDSATKEQIYSYVASMGLPLGQDDQVMLSLGLSSQDIKSFDSKYGVSSSGK
jgi:hypothetical protein